MDKQSIAELLAIVGEDNDKDTEIDQTLYKKPDWAVEQIVRASGLVENVCCHGVGHPHPASVAEFEARGIMSMGVHGCDLCCCDEETKARIRNEIKEWSNE